ncbi:hypothetical protein BZA77DRAFT_385062 [Pyronema omphalodes]|nr:hypothetical protein BZA77DRAFT_385062 [Pyronema omphalodes]
MSCLDFLAPVPCSIASLAPGADVVCRSSRRRTDRGGPWTLVAGAASILSRYRDLPLALEAKLFVSHFIPACMPKVLRNRS